MSPVPRMHPDEVETDAVLVRRLLTAQFPRWASLPVARVESYGTDNALYRLGDELVVRLPRIGWAARQVEKDWRWLPQLAPHLPLLIPVPLAVGEAAEGYPWRWGVYPWIEGDEAAPSRLRSLSEAAVDLADFVLALQRIDASEVSEGEPNHRGTALAPRDARAREAITALTGEVDARAVTAAWESALAAPAWSRPPVWFHGDLGSGNLLVREGRLSAVIDFGLLNVGDPACDLIVAWELFDEESREVYRAALGVDEATWLRGRGWALLTALQAIPYYRDTNPVIVASAWRRIHAVVADIERGD